MSTATVASPSFSCDARGCCCSASPYSVDRPRGTPHGCPHAATRVERRRCAPCGAGAQRRVVIEHATLELDELRARFEPELLREVVPQLLERAQRLGLPAGPVRREHALPAQALVERVLVGERVELAQRFEVLTALEARLGPRSDSASSRRRSRRARSVTRPRPRELLERGAAPESERAVEQPQPAPEIGLGGSRRAPSTRSAPRRARRRAGRTRSPTVG